MLLGAPAPWPERPGFKFVFPHLQTMWPWASHCFPVPYSFYVRQEKSTSLGCWELRVCPIVSSQYLGASIKFTIEKQGCDVGASPTSGLLNPEAHTNSPSCLFHFPIFLIVFLQYSSWLSFLSTWLPHDLLWEACLLSGLPVSGCASSDPFPTWKCCSASKAHLTRSFPC